jgi:hypothetical protein
MFLYILLKDDQGLSSGILMSGKNTHFYRCLILILFIELMMISL